MVIDFSEFLFRGIFNGNSDCYGQSLLPVSEYFPAFFSGKFAGCSSMVTSQIKNIDTTEFICKTFTKTIHSPARDKASTAHVSQNSSITQTILTPSGKLLMKEL